jgi:molecular chaperone GrpE
LADESSVDKNEAQASRAADGSSATATEPHEAPESTTAGALAALTRERDEFYDRFLRKSAEFDNYRKRIERERREQADQSVIDLLLELLPVVDDFDRALASSSDESAAAHRKGVQLIHAKLHDFLKKQGVRPIEAVGADFDPNIHQAVSHEVSPDHREGEVMGEMQRGYLMGERLLRPSMVKVARRE